jgi:methylated-DNA-protein-cysteine methyltransferase-like protein
MTFVDRVYKITEKIPRGKVATYGQIAALAGTPRGAIMVGRALHNLMNKEIKIPWHRVINREGRISTTCIEHPAFWQAKLLGSEGIKVEKRSGNYFVDLREYLWKPKMSFRT